MQRGARIDGQVPTYAIFGIGMFFIALKNQTNVLFENNRNRRTELLLYALTIYAKNRRALFYDHGLAMIANNYL